MAKKLLLDYTFDSTANSVTVDGIFRKERVLLITNVTDGINIYQFNSATKKINSISYDYDLNQTTFVLNYDTSAMSNTDDIQIFVEQDEQSFRPSQTYTDPVSKFRVSQPENLIDTDFEYGLQSTKWETLETVKNIPTFFSRSGENSIDISSLTTQNGSDVVTVTTAIEHGFLRGSPIIIQGSRNISCDGSFIVTAVSNTTAFQYKAKATQTFTGSIKDTYTSLYPASVYQGTEFRLNTLDSVTTSGVTNSTITVTTESPTDFIANTSMYLVGSVGGSEISFNASNTVANNFNTLTLTSDNDTATGESGFTIGGVQPYAYVGTENTLYFVANGVGNTVTVNTSVSPNRVDLISGVHGFADNTPVLYVQGEGNQNIGGLVSFRGYIVRTVNTSSFYLVTSIGNTTPLALVNPGINRGVMRSAFIKAYQITQEVGGTTDAWDTSTAHDLLTNSYTPLIIFPVGQPVTFWTGATSLINPAVFYSQAVISTTRFRVSATVGGAASTALNNIGYGVNSPVYFIRASSLLSTRWTYYVENHGLTTDTVVTLSANNSLPSGFTNNASYRVEFVTSNRFRLKNPDTNALIQTTTVGNTEATFTFTVTTPNASGDTLYLPNNQLTDGQLVVYDSDGNDPIGGLSNGSVYYVFQKTADRVKLATTAEGWDGAAVNISSYNTTTNRALIAGPTFANGSISLLTQSNPPGGLQSGSFYWTNSPAANTVTFHTSYSDSLTGSNPIELYGTPSGPIANLRRANLVDLTSANTGTHKLISTVPGSSDGVYNISNVTSNNTFEFTASSTIPLRTIPVSSNASIDLKRSAFFANNHYFNNGTAVTYTTTGTEIGGLANNTTYYVIRTSQNWFKLANTALNANTGNNIIITSTGTGNNIFTTTSISGETTGGGTVNIVSGNSVVSGLGTNFTADFSPGDQIIVYNPPSYVSKTVSSINTTTDVFTSNLHALVDGDPVIMTAVAPPGGTSNDFIYYVRTTGSGAVTNNFTLHNTYDDAISGVNNVNVTTAGTTVAVRHVNSIGNSTVLDIKYVNSQTSMQLVSNSDVTFTSSQYAKGTALLVRADGFSLHRPYDGGVEIVPSKNPDASMIRQTRKYFRYQSGKGIQVSFAVNFKPSIQVESYTNSGNTATVTTRYPHRLSPGLDIVMSGATASSGTNYYNGTFEVLTVPDEYTFTFELAGTPNDTSAGNLSQFYVDSWQNSLLRCGLFDDQNGMFFEFDGQILSLVRRNSTTQISGAVNIAFKSGTVTGVNTKFTTQLAKGNYIVIKGQTYLVTNIVNDTQLNILPSYRGVDFEGAIVAKTIDLKFPQSEWNLDKCDGTGPSGFLLDKSKIQMAYMDYSWYGAGKVRFGFKDQHGDVFYVHEIVHGNREVEAYLRSGNLPARYEVTNVGQPTYVPSLAHWGTSVIMDGRFDDDKAYIFTAASNPFSIFSAATASTNGRIETTSRYFVNDGTRYRDAGFAIALQAANSSLNTLTAGLTITGANLAASTVLANPASSQISPFQPYLPGVSIRIGSSTNTISQATKTLLLVDKQPVATAVANTAYSITLAASETPITGSYPIISIRLAPSVDSGSPGLLGERDILNRMQLLLNSLGIVSTHTAEISLVLNGQLNNNNWERVQTPSLSQLIYHNLNDTVIGGTRIFTFRASGGNEVTTGARSPAITTTELGDVASLGNSILGGDGTFPDGPDVLTVVAKLSEDVSKVTNTNPFNISARISWSESQA